MKVFIVLFFMGLTSLVQAEENRRPSWSQGLPEKTAAPNRNIPKIDQPEVDVAEPRVGIERPSGIELDASMALPALVKPTAQGADHPVATQNAVEEHMNRSEVSPIEPSQTTKVPAVRTAVEQPSNVISRGAEQSASGSATIEVPSKKTLGSGPNHSNYSWHITRQFPVKVSPALQAQYPSVLLKLMINNQGAVVGVDRVLEETPEALVAQAERSLKRWRFVAPGQAGVADGLLQKVFEVPLSAR